MNTCISAVQPSASLRGGAQARLLRAIDGNCFGALHVGFPTRSLCPGITSSRNRRRWRPCLRPDRLLLFCPCQNGDALESLAFWR
jgi:hypothetical protein